MVSLWGVSVAKGCMCTNTNKQSWECEESNDLIRSVALWCIDLEKGAKDST